MRRAKRKHDDHIQSWLDLARLIEQLGRQATNWIFRGEPSTTYELRPAAGREGMSEESARTIRLFTVHPDPVKPFQDRRLRYWTISGQASGDLKSVLDACAINYASLFPDLQGLARHVGWRYKWGLPQGHVAPDRPSTRRRP